MVPRCEYLLTIAGYIDLIYGYVLEMETAHVLKEIRTPQSWEDMKARLTQDQLPPFITGVLWRATSILIYLRSLGLCIGEVLPSAY